MYVVRPGIGLALVQYPIGFWHLGRVLGHAKAVADAEGEVVEAKVAMRQRAWRTRPGTRTRSSRHGWSGCPCHCGLCSTDTDTCIGIGRYFSRKQDTQIRFTIFLIN
jgi:hypothetical protein